MVGPERLVRTFLPKTVCLGNSRPAARANRTTFARVVQPLFDDRESVALGDGPQGPLDGGGEPIPGSLRLILWCWCYCDRLRMGPSSSSETVAERRPMWDLAGSINEFEEAAFPSIFGCFLVEKRQLLVVKFLEESLP